ncbi:LPXTG cell wall anchor domain-containing protein [Levilactobacillus andaensis]|uniref:LPXTG cell wall anchor domain-containing protein n=1 Tax=Levilactobacillus andaensis TaxID=2799570 RepID=UPI001F3052F7|nr:LPXTG cell wall anchor domain-containing protein [Levilactobacillus andaensis]
MITKRVTGNGSTTDKANSQLAGVPGDHTEGTAGGDSAANHGDADSSHDALPQTGEQDTGEATSVVGSILLGFLGLLGFKPRRKRDD